MKQIENIIVLFVIILVGLSCYDEMKKQGLIQVTPLDYIWNIVLFWRDKK